MAGLAQPRTWRVAFPVAVVDAVRRLYRCRMERALAWFGDHGVCRLGSLQAESLARGRQHGVWLALSPWAIGFNGQRPIFLNAVIVGLLVIAMAAWAMLRDIEFDKWWHRATS